LPGDDGLDAVPNTASAPLEIVGDDIRFQTVEPGEVIGVPINGASGQPTQLTPRQHGAAIRRNEVQAITLTAGAGSGSGGEFTDADIVLNAETTELRITTAGTGDVLIAGIDSENTSGHTVTIDYFTGNHTVQKIRFLHNSGEAGSGRSFICPTENGSGIDFELSQRFSTAQIGNSGGFWRILGSAQFPFGNSSANSELDVQIVDSGGRWRSRRLVPNDIDSPELFVQAESDLPAASGGVITIPANTHIKVRGLVTVTGNARFAMGAGCSITGFSRDLDGLIFDTPGQHAITLAAGQSEFTLSNCRVQNSSTTGGGITTSDSTLTRFNAERFRLDLSGGDAMTIGGTGLNFNLNLCSLSGFNEGISLPDGGSVLSFKELGLVQTDGTGGVACLDLGSGTWFIIDAASMFIQTAASGFGLSGLASSGNLISGGDATWNQVRFVGAGTALENITEDDLQHRFNDCVGTLNSVFAGEYGMSANGTATTISALGAFVVIAGTTVEGQVHRMTMSNNNEMTIQWLENVSCQIEARATLRRASGSGGLLYNLAIFVDGVQVGATPQIECDANPRYCETSAITTLTTGNIVQVRVSQAAGTLQNVVANSLVLTITKNA
jgi:hypothetical protein